VTNAARQPSTEWQLRTGIRTSLEAWSRFALAPSGQQPALHHLKIIEALEQVSAGDIRRLIMMLPPGSAKSTYASRLFPAWWLARNPASAVITACHTARLAEHFGRSVRGLLEEHALPLGVRVRPDARAAARFLTEGGGEYFAVGVQGAVTGRRADLALIDDPIRSFADAENFAAREHLWEWFRSELVTRLKPRGRVILVMTRWHCDDLAGRLIEQGGWSTLRLPALAEEGDALGRAPGAALWPEWEDVSALCERRSLLGERHFSALFQQSPLHAAGQMFDVRKLRLVDAVPDGGAVRAWDLAGSIDTTGDPDWTVGLRLVRDATGAVFVDDVIRFRGESADVASRIRATAEADGIRVPVGLPQDPGQAGKSQVLFLTRLLAGWRVMASPETGSKTVRATPIASQIGNGAVSVRRAGWNAAFLDELANFPNGAKDDQVDALARAFAMLLELRAPARFANLTFSSR
jgi:predicted phage terminase large subunit-like protein